MNAKRLINDLKFDFLLIIGVIIALIFSISILTQITFAQDMTSKKAVMNRNERGVTLYDRNGTAFFKLYDAPNKSYIPLSDISEITQQAIIAAEDKSFYKHDGLSVKAISGAILADVKKKDFAYGGSTITQQLAKTSFLNFNKDLLRKYQEVILAQNLEKNFNKNDILEMYLNSVYFGEGATGIEAAANAYFGKSAKELDLAESSMIAGLLTAPSALSPISGNSNKAKIRQHYVLENMVEQKYITKDQALQAENEQLKYNSSTNILKYLAPHFALTVKNELIKKYGEEYLSKSGFKVYTTIDLNWQKYAEQVVAKQVKNLTPNNVSNASAVVLDPKTGEIRAMVGSVNWYNDKFGQVNMATTPRQPGSSFKPIVYLTAFEKGLITPTTLLHDNPTVFPGGYKPLDYDKKFRGPVLPRRALANSLNIPAVEVMTKVGVPAVLDRAKDLGVTTLGDDASNYGSSLVLGTGEVSLLELTNVYAIFANYGLKATPTTIHRVEDKFGRTVYVNDPKLEEVVDPKFAFLITSILSDNQTRREGFGNLLDVSIPAAVKTGTSEDYKNSLTLGYTPNLAVGVWVGNTNSTSMDNIAGSLGAAPIWKALITKFSEGQTIQAFQPPMGVVKVSMCGLATKQASYSAHTEYFLEGTEPKQRCTPQVKIATNSNLQPTSSPQTTPNITQAPQPSQPSIITPPPIPTPPQIVISPINEDQKIRK